MDDAGKPAEPAQDNRRPIAARGNALVQRVSAALARAEVAPNAISLASIVFALIAVLALLRVDNPWGPLLCAVCIQLRLLCNLFDGMVAVEGGRKTATGMLYNEVPDRIADSVLIVALGYAVGFAWLGWLGALLAALTAYIRTLGGALGQVQDFRGPMAKQQRMATMTLACVLAPVEMHFAHSRWLLLIALLLITIGSALTCGTRLHAIATRLGHDA